ncbi:hypothetical protein [Amycolatopsis taiwanensis]|uniref:Uncharacterized protein n=1 Tax=Amycolatopsis taiwanensis TaxID=342230 RepID=A0A9W6QYI8_9PSEU|nr:hypothetical protein [Amycolatopsis taiwanensis]GLY65190.1 hypothetical protein Atai01_18090 [Amycolatopsis taiwanensis]
MTTLIVFLILLGGIGAALEYNHRRNHPSLPAGSTNFDDRDQVRMRQELRILTRNGHGS